MDGSLVLLELGVVGGAVNPQRAFGLGRLVGSVGAQAGASALGISVPADELVASRCSSGGASSSAGNYLQCLAGGINRTAHIINHCIVDGSLVLFELGRVGSSHVQVVHLGRREVSFRADFLASLVVPTNEGVTVGRSSGGAGSRAGGHQEGLTREIHAAASFSHVVDGNALLFEQSVVGGCHVQVVAVLRRHEVSTVRNLLRAGFIAVPALEGVASLCRCSGADGYTAHHLQHFGRVGNRTASFSLGDVVDGYFILSIVEGDDVDRSRLLRRLDTDVQRLGLGLNNRVIRDVDGRLGHDGVVRGFARLGRSQLLTGTLLQVAHLVGIIDTGVVQLQLHTFCRQHTGHGILGNFSIVLITVDIRQRRAGVCLSDETGHLAGRVFHPDRLAILGGRHLDVVSDLVVSARFILLVVEDDHVAVGIRRAQHQTLLIRVGHVAVDNHLRLGHDGLYVVIDLLGSNQLLVGLAVNSNRTQRVGCIRIIGHVVHGVGHGVNLHIVEGEDVLAFIFNVNHQGMALHLGEVALLVTFIQLRTALGLEGQGGTGRRGVGDGLSNEHVASRRLDRKVDGIFHQLVGGPLRVHLQIPGDGHVSEGECLFIAVLINVEPGNKFVLAIGGFCHVLSELAVENCLLGMGSSDGAHARLVLFAVEVEVHGTLHRHPLGVEQHVIRGHGVLAQHILVAGTFGVEVPAGEAHRARLVDVGRIRREIVVTQGHLILHADGVDVFLAVIEGQVIAVTGVVELSAGATRASGSTAALTEGKAFEFIVVFLGYSIAANAINSEQFDAKRTVQALAVVKHGTGAAGTATVVVGRTVLRHHHKCIGVGAVAAGLSRPEGTASIVGNGQILISNIGAPLGSDHLRLVVLIVAVIVIVG